MGLSTCLSLVTSITPLTSRPPVPVPSRPILHHLPAAGDGVALGWLPRHLGLPMSTASVAVKASRERALLRGLEQLAAAAERLGEGGERGGGGV
jgi:hypothetical protein